MVQFDGSRRIQNNKRVKNDPATMTRLVSYIAIEKQSNIEISLLVLFSNSSSSRSSS